MEPIELVARSPFLAAGDRRFAMTSDVRSEDEIILPRELDR